MQKQFTILFTAVLLAVLSACATVPTPAGKWTADIDTPQGPMKIGYEFQVDGNNLTGTTTNDFMGAIPISEGMVKGKDLSFKVKMEGGGFSMTSVYTGMLEDDKLKLNMKFEGTPPPGAPESMDIVAERVKEE